MEEDTHSRREAISMRRNNPPFAALLFFTIASGKLWYGLQDGSLDARSIVWMTVIVAELGVYVVLRLVGESLPPLGRMYIPSQMRQGVSVKDSKDEGGRWHIPQRAIHDRLGDRPPRLASLESREVGSGRAGKGLVGVRYPAMREDPIRRRPPLTDDAYTPSDADTRRMSPHESAASSGWTTTALAARALGVAQRTVQSYVQRGILEAKSEGEGVKKTLYISIDSLNALRARRIAEGKIGEDAPQSAPDEPAADFAVVVQNLAARMADEAARAAALEARLELTERAESTLQAERNQLRQDLERERQERQEAQEDANKERERALELEIALREARKGFWRRLFGG